MPAEPPAPRPHHRAAPVHRLRDLRGRSALVAALLVAALVFPFVLSVVRSVHVGWVPAGDDALIGLRSLDVTSGHLPLIGQPSTSHLYDPALSTSHPGPIEFYWLALPMRILGATMGMVLGAGAVNLASVLVAAWVVLRRAGPAAAAWSAALLGFVLWSEGTAVLTDTISSNAGGIPMLALAALAWAIADGDLRLLPLGALFGSWVAQQHLAIALPAATLVLFAVVGAAAGPAIHQWRTRRGAGDEPTGIDEAIDAVWPREELWADGHEPAEPVARARRWPWVLGALVVALACWSPVLWQQATGHPGNLTAIVDYARTSDTASVGKVSGVRQAVRAMGFPPLLTRSDLGGQAFYRGPLGGLEVAVAVLMYGALAATVARFWRSQRALAVLALVALALALGGAVNGSTIPASIEAFRINFYRWTFVVAWLGWTALGWAALLVARPLLAARGRAVPASLARLAPALVVALALVPVVATKVTAPGWDDERRDVDGVAMMRTLSDAAVDEARGHHGVTLALRGPSANLSTGAAIALQLVAAGHPVRVPDQDERFWGEHRILHPSDAPDDVILLVVTGTGTLRKQPGRLVARVSINEELHRSLTALLAQAKGHRFRPSSRADQLVAQHFAAKDRSYVKGKVMPLITSNPRALLENPEVLEMIIDGYFESSPFHRADLLALRGALPARNVNLDDVFELRAITAAELAEVVPQWGRGR